MPSQRDPLRSIFGWLNPLRLLRRSAHGLANFRRRFAKIDYILIDLPAAMPALPESRGWLQRRLQGASPLSLWELDKNFERIADDPRPKGVVLMLRGFAMSLADLQTLRASILRLRKRGKRVICYAQGYDNATYYIASAADQILLQPGGSLDTIGLRQQAAFLKDALEFAGVSLDVVAISPFKSAYDQLRRSEPSPEYNEQVNWLLDSRYEMIVNGMAEGRNTSIYAIYAMIDNAPYTDEAALTAGYIDRVLNEEDFAAHLDAKHLVYWHKADRVLFRKWRKSSDKVIALLSVKGLMVTGESGTIPGDLPIPLIGDERAGDRTVVRQIRSFMKNESIGAVVLYIDSGGGAAAAAESMTSALTELAKEQPIVAYMNGVAASGGYYIATAARWIVAQPGTVTGSIGVLSAKPVAGELLEKLRINTVEFRRGANAGIYSEGQPFTPEQRAKMMDGIQRVYRQFIERVAAARGLTTEQVDAIGGGRVWTGTQALDHKLVDELGGLREALAKARSLANLPEETPIMLVKGADSKPIPPQLAETPAATLRYLYENLRSVASGSAQLILPVIWCDS